MKTHAQAASSYGAGQRALEIAAMAAFGAASLAALARLAEAAGLWLPLVLLAAAPLAWLACDLLTGLVHFAFDSLGSVHTPLVGRAFIRPFREHHADPQAMTRHDFVETNGSSALGALPFAVMACLVSLDGLLSTVLGATLLLVAAGAVLANQCHKWAHMDEAETPALVRHARRWRLVVSREEHLRHHTPPFDSHFCMAAGWTNGWLDRRLRARR